MAHYYTLGQIPPKRHTQFRKPDGGLYSEELVGTEGFSSLSSLVYHVHPPTLVLKVGEPRDVAPKIAVEKNLKHRAFLGFQAAPADDFLESRKTLMLNNDLSIAVAAPRHSTTDYFYKNAECDEMLFVHEGSGKLLSGFGEIVFGPGDYLILPRGTIYQIHFDSEDNRLFIVAKCLPQLGA